jgi:hypothetical protein
MQYIPPNYATLFVATCNLLNLANPNRVYYENQDAYNQREYERKIDWIGERFHALNADVLAVQEVWDEAALKAAIARSGLRYDFVSVPGAENTPPPGSPPGTPARPGAQGTPRVGIAGLADLHQQFGLGAGGLHHDHLGRDALAAGGDADVGGPHAVLHGLAVLPCAWFCVGQRWPSASTQLRPPHAQRAGQHVHRRRADELRDEQVAGRSNSSSGVPICSTMPSCITTMRSAMVMASIWSCVT